MKVVFLKGSGKFSFVQRDPTAFSRTLFDVKWFIGTALTNLSLEILSALLISGVADFKYVSHRHVTIKKPIWLVKHW